MAKKAGISRKKADSDTKEYIAYRFYGEPDKGQAIQFSKTFGCARWMYNQLVAELRKSLEENTKAEFPSPAWYKKDPDHSWLKEVDSLALANVQINFLNAVSEWRKGNRRAPKFKNKSDHRDSYTTNVVNRNISFEAEAETGYLKLPKTEGKILIHCHRPVRPGGVLKSVTVTREPNGRHYFSLLYEYDLRKPHHEIDPDNAIGLDMSMHHFYVDSNGETADYGKPYRNIEKRLAREQRRQSHMKKGSANCKKQRRKIASLHAKARHQRQDALHKLSRKLVDEYDVIGVESLNMKGMSQALNFGRSVGDKGWGMFTAYLAFKAKKSGKYFVKVDKYFPSSQMCHQCGTLYRGVKNLNVRQWTCPNCGCEHERDHNAALNLKAEAVRLYCTA